MKIIKMSAENVLRLKAVEIAPDGSVVRIKGNNGQGKSSVLNAIQMALGGKDVQPPRPIRDGADSAQVVLDLGDFIVTRRWTSNDRSYLEVKSREGAKYPSPQAMLDKLVGSLSFDPLEFVRMDAKRQAQTLRVLVGIDTSDLDAQRQAVFEQRTEVNRSLAQAKARLATLPEVEAPAEEVSLSALIEHQQKLLAEKSANDKVRSESVMADRRAADAVRAVKNAESTVARIRAELEQAEKDLELARLQAEKVSVRAAELKQQADALADPDLSAVAEQMRTAEETNRRVRARKAREAEAAQLRQLEERADTLTKSIAKIDADKGAQLAAAKFPVAGLSFDDNGVTFNGVPFSQASAAEQLRVSLAMGLAMNPKLRVMLVRDASLLDEKSMAIVEQMATEAGAQVWLEIVSTSGAGVIIEDGTAKPPEKTVLERERESGIALDHENGGALNAEQRDR